MTEVSHDIHTKSGFEAEESDDEYDTEEIGTNEEEEEYQDSTSQSSLDDIDQEQLIVRYLFRRDTNGLKRLALYNGGFLNDDLRIMVWPRLVKVHVIETSPRPDKASVEAHPFYNQVLLDVNRSLKRFPPSIVEQQRLAMQDQLVRLIMRVLIKNPDLYYYQGYHDICVTFLLVLGEELAFYVLNKISKTHLSIFMEQTMERTCDLLTIIPTLVNLEHSELATHLEKSGVGTIFSLSWVITWFSHVLRRYEDVGRLFDFFLASHPWMPLYLTSAIVLHKQEEILSLDCDMPTIHRFLTNITDAEDLKFEWLIQNALVLYEKHPPEKMKQFVEKAKQLRIRDDKMKRGLIKSFFSIKYFHSNTLISLAVFIVICATLFQYLYKT